ncbi:MAG: Trk system potassium transporter TrkA [Acidimicrobiales bacterium]
MHVIVIGAGEVGSYLAERLSREGHDVVVVDKDSRRLGVLAEQLDVLTVRGSGTQPSVLDIAGVKRCDVFVAVTSTDEVNLVSCLVAHRAGAGRTIARIEEPELRDRQSRELHRVLGIDLVIDPDDQTAQEILDLLEFPGATEIMEMAGGEVVVIGARLPPDAPLVGRTLHEVALEHEPEWEFLFGIITRDGQTIIPRGEHRLEANDLLRVLCKRRALDQLVALLGIDHRSLQRVMLLGGGRTAELVASRLEERGADVTIVERDTERARELAERLDKVLVIEGEITDADLLADAGVGTTDVVVALTGEDDANILACLFSKLEGAGETIAVVHRLSLLPLLGQAGIDVALSPRTASANGVLRFVRGGVTQVTTFLQGDVEALELVVQEKSPADGALVTELRLPKDVLLGAIIRDGKAQIARGRTELRDRDHVIVFSMPHSVDEVKRVFG